MRPVVMEYIYMTLLRHAATKVALLMLLAPASCSIGQDECLPDQAVGVARARAKALSWNINGWHVKVDNHPKTWAVHFRHPQGGAGGEYSFAINKKNCTIAEEIGFQ